MSSDFLSSPQLSQDSVPNHVPVSMSAYNHYKEVGDDSTRSTPRVGGRDYVELSTSEDSSPLTSKDSISASHLPDTPSSSFSTTSPIMPPPSQPDMYTPTPSKLAIATGLLIVLSSLTHLSNGKLDRRGLRDLKDYFVGRGLEASRWEVPREDTTCVRRSWEKSHEEGEWREGELSSLSVCMGVGETLML